ncbi:ABC transporter permease [Actinomyces polynesiensis]|uniref:ABC transporter permease n=1 Tax=Actinomyces polynesiensis TaxID=1325934 RepID=UPI0005BD709D|nr:ABC transporter permease [Actinomyces polynesiensis]
MFLALREIRHQPTRFVLIVAVITLVSYLTFFLAALAGGLAHSYRSAVDDWGARSVVLTEASNRNVSASRLSGTQLDAVPTSPDTSTLLTTPVVLEDAGGTKVDATVFGLPEGSFLMPSVEEGSAPTDPSRQVVVDDSLKDEGWAIGQTFTLTGSDHEWEVSGFAHDQSFQALPVVFIDQDALVKDGPSSVASSPNAVVSRDDLSGDRGVTDAGLEVLDASEFVNTLPGYSAQVLTFTLMIGSLIVIASFVLGIFIYVLTLQKRPVLGILKARGVPTGYLILSGAVQTALLSAAGVAIGLALTLLSALVLPRAVPFRVDAVMDAAITAAFIAFAVLGGLISVRVVSHIDPVEAIS